GLRRTLAARSNAGAACRRRSRGGRSARRARLRVEELLQTRGVLHRESLPVVVEVRVDVDVPAAHAIGPLSQLRLAVVAAPSADAVVEADVRPRCREDLALAGEHERGAVVS